MTPQEQKAAKTPYRSVTKFDLKPTPEYVVQGEGASRGGRRHGHHAELDPAFAAAKPGLDAAARELWCVPDRTWASVRGRLAGRPQPCQHHGTGGCSSSSPADVDVSHSTVRVRDGAQIKIKTMRRPALDDDERRNRGGSLLVLRMHGGGWCLDPQEAGQDAEDMRVAGMPNVVVVNPSYRLAPEYPYPYALNDCYDVLLWCKLNAEHLGIDPERILLIGSDAGANLAACVALKARDKGVTGIVGQVLNFPVTCHPKFHAGRRLELRSYEQNVEATTVSAPLLELFWDTYVPEAEEDAYHSPLLAESLAYAPPALIQVAGFDPLRDEGITFAERLKGQGVVAELHVYKGLPHGFPNVLPGLPQTGEFLKRQNDFIMRCASREGLFSAKQSM